MSDEKIAVLYVDDEENNLLSFRATFRHEFKIFTAISGEEGIRILETEPIHVIVTDQKMPQMTGVQFLEKIIPRFPEPKRILLTGFTDISAVIDAINKGKVHYYLTKPWDETQLHTIIKNLYNQFSLEKQNKELTSKLAEVNQKLEFMLRQKLLD